MYAAIVFLPILGSAIAGLFGRLIGNRASELVTTGLLFVSAALSVIAFNDVALQGHNYIIPILPWIHSGAFVADWTVRIDSITAGVHAGVDRGPHPDAHFFHRTNAKQPP